jgi:hypothetical protein
MQREFTAQCSQEPRFRPRRTQKGSHKNLCARTNWWPHYLATKGRIGAELFFNIDWPKVGKTVNIYTKGPIVEKISLIYLTR